MLGVGLVLVTGPVVDAQTAPIVGSLDTSFDSDGKVTTGFETVHANAQALSVAVQSDGKIVVAGDSYNGSNLDVAVARYNADGSLDIGFGTGGKVTTAIGSGEDAARSVAVQSDGKIVVAGYSHNGSNLDFAVVRYNSDGSLDTSFDSDGMVTTAIGSDNDLAQSVAVQSDGKIVVAGYGNTGTNDDFAVVRYNANGSLDASFDSDGKVTTAVGSGRDRAFSVAVQSDGKVVAAGYSHNGTNNDFAVVRYNADGSLDTGFDSDGMVTTAVGSGSDLAFSVVVQSDGKIITAGYSHNGTNNDFAVVRYNADGSLDTGFDSDGKVTTAVGTGGDDARSMVLQSDGKIVVAGYSENGSNNDFAVVRYSADGSLDTSFDSDGMVTTAIGSGDDLARSVALQSNGKIVVAGSSDTGGDGDFAVVRYNSDGSLDDTDFDSDGKITTFIGAIIGDFSFSAALQSDGKIVAAGESFNGNNNDFTVVRYHADGSLDTGFGTGGKVTTAVGTGAGHDAAHSVVVQSDGKIVAAGESWNGLDLDVAVVRYNADGSLDTSFGTDGIVTTAVGSGKDVAHSAALQSDGKIVVVGESEDDFAVVRYNSDGSLDTGFSTDGKVTTAVGSGSDLALSVVLQSDGKIVAAGYSHNGSNNDFAVVRYDVDGSLDTGFSTDGKVTTAIGTGNDSARSVVLQSDGKIVAAGYSDNGRNNDFALVRYNTDGSLDTGFDTDGKVTTAIGTDQDRAFSVAVQSDDKIVAAGYSYNGANLDFAVVRYNANGSLDTGFDTDGKVTTAIGTGGDRAYSVVLQSDGKIVAAGYSDNGRHSDFALVRYNADGSLDDTGFDRPAFGTDGKVTTRFETVLAHDDVGFSVALQPDGKILIAGESIKDSDSDFALVRYNADGSLDTSFGTGGKVTTAIGTGYDEARSVVVQSGGKIVVAGSSENGSNTDFALVRYNADGSLDTGFDTDGIVTTAIGSGDDAAFSVVVQSGGKIVAAGHSHNGSNNDFAVVRYNADGSLDIGFGTGGKVTTAIGSGADVAFSVVVQSDRKIVAAGHSDNGSNNDFAVVRYNSDGSLDTNFATDGKVTTPIGSRDEARSVVVQSDGKIVVAGSSENGSNTDFALVRYNADGSLDTGFDTDGIVTTAIGSGDDAAFSVVVQSGGKIVAAGHSHNGSNNDFAVVRYNADGSLDTGFDSDGKVTAAIGSDDDLARSVVVQSDGKIVAAGSSHNGNDHDFAVVRWHGKVPSRPPVRRPVYTPPPPPERFDLEVRRVGGTDRFETSVLLAGEYAALAGRLDAVVLASGANFPDALSASALAGSLDAPLLYVGPGGLPEQVAEFIRDNSVAKVYIVGGEAAVSAEVQTAAASLEPVQAVTRISGADRYGTSVEVASHVARLGAGVSGWCGGAKTVLLTNGVGFADALSASPAAAAGPHPLLLTSTDALPETVASWLSAAAGARTVEQVVIVGGTAAVSSSVESSIDAMGLRTVRIAGADRYSTSAEFARRTECIAKNHLAAATGVDYADGLTAGPLLARLGGALVLVQPEAVPDPISDYAAATRRFRRTSGSTLWILGGRTAVSNGVKTALRNTIRDANAP